MSKTYKLNRASDKNLNDVGAYSDGLGLYLQVSKTGSKSWKYRYSLNGRRRNMGLGKLSLANHLDSARKKATKARQLVEQGIDPIDHKDGAKAVRVKDRDGPNPATWRGNLDQLLTPKERVKPSKNHPALPWQEIPELMKKLRGMDTPASYLTEFIILTASRSGEARGALWQEIDLEENVWSISAERMKMKRPHIVPLEGAAKDIVERVLKYRNLDLVFENPRSLKAFSYNAPMVTLRKLGYNHITTHGFRSSFKTWALEATNFPTQAIEFALAHETKNTVERAYIRGNKMLDKRREVMIAWDDYCSS